MKKVILLACMMFFGTAKATVISLDVNDTNPTVGDTVSVSISLTDVTDDFASLFTGIQFDASAFQYVEGSVNSDFPGFDDVTFSGLDVDTVLAGDGSLFFNLFEDIFMPVSYSMGDFLVASFDLLAVSAGTSTLALLDTTLFAAGSFDEIVPTDGVTTVSANVVGVSAPSVFALLSIAGIALFGFRRKA